MKTITDFLTEQSALISSITGVFTVLGVFWAVFTYRYQKRKDRENNMPVINFPSQKFVIKIIEKESTINSKAYLTPAFFNEENIQVYSIDTIGRNVGLNALQIKKIKIKKVTGFKPINKYAYSLTPSLILQDKKVMFYWEDDEYIFGSNFKINGNQITGFVHKDDYFTIEYHPFLLEYIAHNLLKSYHNRGVLVPENLKFSERWNQHSLFIFKIAYKDVNGKTHKKKIEVIGQIEPREDYYVVRIGYISK